MAEDVEVGSNGNGGDDETGKTSPLSKKSNRPMGYLISLRSNADSVPFAKDEFPLIVLAMVEAPS